MDREKGQVALLLILAMTVMGVISVSLASRSVSGLRTTEIDQGSTAAFKAAEAGLERATLNRANVSGALTGGNTSYSATYDSSGSNGFISSVPVKIGDVISVSLVGAVGITALNIYWSNNAAIKTTDLRGNTATAEYGVRYQTSDPDGTRAANNFTPTADTARYTFLGKDFQYKLLVPVNLTISPASKFLNILVLYAETQVGVEPVGGTLASGQVVSVSSTGTAGQFSSKVTEQRFTQKLPEIFDNVLYSNQIISQ